MTSLLALMACNKDEEVTIDTPDDPQQTASEFNVMEYMPAPGQFINEKASGFIDITTMQEACEYAEKRFATGNYVSLGAWGGYIVVKSRSPIANSGNYDFSIFGNAFDTSNEPGIVWVMTDTNSNGLPDDEWYELRGSDYGKEGYEKDYWVTYYRPIGDQADIAWTDSNDESGFIYRNIYHKQSSYFPTWAEGSSYTLHGSRLPARIIETSEGIWSNKPFEWGYADNDGEDSRIQKFNGKIVQENFFRISDAVDGEGKAVNLDHIDFIKVQTAINANTLVTGENSTEVCGFSRL